MELVITIDPSYLGVCSRCLTDEAKHKVWETFDIHIPAVPGLNLPEVKGAWVYVCSKCYDKLDEKDKKATPTP